MALVVHGVLLLGIVALALTYISKLFPLPAAYNGPARIAAVAIICAGLYLEGAYGTHQWYQNEVKELQEKIAEAEAKSEELNTQLTTEIQKNSEIITNHTESVQTIIRENTVTIDKECKVDPLVIDILNNSAKNPLAGENK
ncbi:MAG: hypothetical protein ABFC84_00410 [Veillonellales bacterium]